MHCMMTCALISYVRQLMKNCLEKELGIIMCSFQLIKGFYEDYNYVYLV
jgi:hypothetical protein